MILSGRTAVSHKIVTNPFSATTQTQLCGFEPILKRVMLWISSGTIDLDNTHRKTANKSPIPIQSDDTGSFPDLSTGSYLVEFNKTVYVPLGFMGRVIVRSSPRSCGAHIQAGIVDSGYEGAVGAMLQGVNTHGLRRMKDAKLAKVMSLQMSETVKEYSGVYHGSVDV